MTTSPQGSRTKGWVILLFLGAAGFGAMLAVRPNIIRAALGSPQAVIVNAAIAAIFLGVALVLHRLRAPFVVRAVIIGGGLLAMLIWTVLPAFRTVRVDEELPGQPAAAAPATPSADGATPAPATPSADGATPAPAADAPTDLAAGTFVGLDGHDAAGRARLVSVDGGTVLRLEDFAVTNGPDLRVILTTAEDQSAQGGIDLGALKGNEGNQNYEVPADVDIATVGSVLIWCRAFDVDFGAAPLQP